MQAMRLAELPKKIEHDLWRPAKEQGRERGIRRLNVDASCQLSALLRPSTFLTARCFFIDGRGPPLASPSSEFCLFPHDRYVSFGHSGIGIEGRKNDSPSASATTLRRLPRPLLAGIMLFSQTSSKKKLKSRGPSRWRATVLCLRARQTSRTWPCTLSCALSTKGRSK